MDVYVWVHVWKDGHEIHQRCTCMHPDMCAYTWIYMNVEEKRGDAPKAVKHGDGQTQSKLARAHVCKLQTLAVQVMHGDIIATDTTRGMAGFSSPLVLPYVAGVLAIDSPWPIP